MRALKLWHTLVAALVLSACTTTPKVNSDFGRNANFSSYRTFGFVDSLATDKSGYSTLMTGYFKNAVQREMVGYARGGIAAFILYLVWRDKKSQFQAGSC